MDVHIWYPGQGSIPLGTAVIGVGGRGLNGD